MPGKLTISPQALRTALRTGMRRLQAEAARALLRTGLAAAQAMDPPPSARSRGEKAIDRDLNRIFVPRDLKGHRPERWPDVEGIWRARQSKAKARQRRSWGQSTAYYVDRRKLEALRARVKGRVGRVDAGRSALATLVGHRLPAWVSRHGPMPGTARLTKSDRRVALRFSNDVSYASNVTSVRTRWQLGLRRARHTLGPFATAAVVRAFR